MAALAKIRAEEEARGAAVLAFDPAPVDHDSCAVADGDRSSSVEIERLFAALDRVTPSTHPRTARLLAAGRIKLARKVMEEAGEVAVEVVKKKREPVVRESADLIYQLVLLWHICGIAPGDVWAEMRRRADTYGIAEKQAKTPARHGSPRADDS
jgi:phosphoribosyl-ATP pyrophosphohydrolase